LRKSLSEAARKSTLTDRARQIVKDAADNSTKVQYTRINQPPPPPPLVPDRLSQ
jgi:hypothetical protein